MLKRGWNASNIELGIEDSRIPGEFIVDASHPIVAAINRNRFCLLTPEQGPSKTFVRVPREELRESMIALKKEIEKGLEVPEPSAPPIEEESASPECVVCLDAEPVHAVVPCGHLCLCAACVEMLPEKRCPLCKVPFTSTLRVYIS